MQVGVIEEDAMSTPYGGQPPNDQGGQPGNGQDGQQWSGQQPDPDQDDSGATTVYRPGDMLPDAPSSSPSHAATADTGPQSVVPWKAGLPPTSAVTL